jgi:hypothetical protein
MKAGPTAGPRRRRCGRGRRFRIHINDPSVLSAGVSEPETRRRDGPPFGEPPVVPRGGRRRIDAEAAQEGLEGAAQPSHH